MSEWDEIVEYIHNAMQAVDEAHRAAEKLRQDTNHTNFHEFRRKMAELQERQRQLQMVLEDEEAYAVDELVDALSVTLTGHRADYRRTPRMTEEAKTS